MIAPPRKRIPLRIVLRGNPNAGKTTLFKAFTDGEHFHKDWDCFGHPTVLDVLHRTFDVEDFTVVLEMFDTLAFVSDGNEPLWRESDCVLFCYDLSYPRDITSKIRDYWLEDLQKIRDNNPELVVISVGTKLDKKNKKEKYLYEENIKKLKKLIKPKVNLECSTEWYAEQLDTANVNEVLRTAVMLSLERKLKKHKKLALSCVLL